MAGGGTTIDVCRYLLRRYYCFDIDPKRPDIKKWDIRHGYPRLPYKPDFIILDPPYWRLERDEYSSDGAASPKLFSLPVAINPATRAQKVGVILALN
jgi:hypothetical protein